MKGNIRGICDCEQGIPVVNYSFNTDVFTGNQMTLFPLGFPSILVWLVPNHHFTRASIKWSPDLPPSLFPAVGLCSPQQITENIYLIVNYELCLPESVHVSVEEPPLKLRHVLQR